MFKIFIDRFRTKHIPPPPEAGTISLRTASVEEIWSTWRYEKPDKPAEVARQSASELRQKSANRAEQVNQLKRVGEYEKALHIVLSEIEREEKNSAHIADEKVPWYYWEAATIFRRLKRYDEEIAIVRRFVRNYNIHFRAFSKRHRTTKGHDAWAARFLERIETAKAAAAARNGSNLP